MLALLMLAGLVGFFLPIAQRLKHVCAAPGTLEYSNLGRRSIRFFREVILQEKIIRERPLAGTMHALVFWGFMAFGLVTMDHFAIGFGRSLVGHGKFANGLWWFAALFAVLVLVGILELSWRRFIQKPKALGKFSPGSFMVACLIITLMVTHLIAPSFEVGSLGQKVNWWLHALAILAFLFLIPHSKHLHLVLGPFTTFFKDFELAAIKPLDFENEEFGAETMKDLSKHTALGAFSCVECGRCQDHCPAFNTDKLLNPKQLMLDLKKAYLTKPDAKISGEAVDPSIFWQCTTCGACTFQCPVGIDQVVPILETRRGLVAAGEFPQEMRALFENLERSGNPWGYPKEDADKFLDEKKIPSAKKGGVLFWMGCMGRYDEKYRKTTESFVEFLNASGKNWGVLRDETCTGDSARRAGNEFLFQQLAEQNIEKINEAEPSMIVSTCPHCIRTMSEYKDMGLKKDVKVVHHTEMISNMMANGDVEVEGKKGDDVVYHDPCYLSRYSEAVEEPRDIIEKSGHAIKEPERTKTNSFCCGAGGAMLFAEETQGTRINRERTDELLKTGAKTVAVGCPFCSMMVKDAVTDKGQQDEVVVKDVAELAVERLKQKQA